MVLEAIHISKYDYMLVDIQFEYVEYFGVGLVSRMLIVITHDDYLYMM